jgi:hypothetical protein
MVIYDHVLKSAALFVGQVRRETPVEYRLHLSWCVSQVCSDYSSQYGIIDNGLYGWTPIRVANARDRQAPAVRAFAPCTSE